MGYLQTYKPVSKPVLSLLTVLTSPTHGWLRLAWLLPALATTTTALALGAHIGVRRAAIGVALGWLTVVIVSAQIARDATAPFGMFGQMTAIGVTVVGAAMLLASRRRLDRWSDA